MNVRSGMPQRTLPQTPAVGLYPGMVVVHRAHGFRFVIYTHDHEPAHVHIVGRSSPRSTCLGPDGRPEVVDVRGITRADLRRLFAEVTERRDQFMREWERIHGRAD